MKWWIGLFIAVFLVQVAPLEAARKGKQKEQKVVATHPLAYNIEAPKNWQCIDDKSQLPAKVEMIFMGHAKSSFTPSINVAKERTELDAFNYMHLAKKYHESEPETICRPLGTIETKEGKAEVMQIDRRTGFGEVRFLQASLVKDGVAYVITTTCLQKEFGEYSPDFVKAIRSFKLNSEVVLNP